MIDVAPYSSTVERSRPLLAASWAGQAERDARNLMLCASDHSPAYCFHRARWLAMRAARLDGVA